MAHWIVSSKHSRDESTKAWGDNKWTADAFLRQKRFYPSKRERDFAQGDRCLLNVFGSQEFIGDFLITSEVHEDKVGHPYYDLDQVNEWDYPLSQHLLPPQYSRLLSRNPSVKVKEEVFTELMGIRNFTQNLRINYKNRLKVNVSERQFEDIFDAKNALRQVGLEIVKRQYEVTPGNILDLLCKNRAGDLIVVEIKKHGPDETVGQLARYVTYVREQLAKPAQKVGGLILALDVDEQLIKAARGVDFDVMLYQLVLQ